MFFGPSHVTWPSHAPSIRAWEALRTAAARSTGRVRDRSDGQAAPPRVARKAGALPDPPRSRQADPDFGGPYLANGASHADSDHQNLETGRTDRLDFGSLGASRALPEAAEFSFERHRREVARFLRFPSVGGSRGHA